MSEISIRDVRRLFLDRQGLLRNAQFGRGKAAVLKAVEQMAWVQIDTISVVDRAHHHVLKTRIPNYTESMLDRLLSTDRRVFEYWIHAAAYLPMSDYRFYRPMMEGWHRQYIGPRKVKMAKQVLERIRSDGALGSRHFEDPRNRNNQGWWDWKPAKAALEHLFLAGELMVTRREGFQKVYDLTENVLPADIDTTTPTKAEWLHFIATRMLSALGVGTLHDVAYARTAYRKFTGFALRKDLKTTLDQLVEDGRATAFRIGKDDWYADTTLVENLPGRLGKRQLHFLSPFDNVVINRARAQALFGFDYMLECYTPEPKRQYGYFCLPMLWGDEIIGRADTKAVREQKTLEVRGLFLEPGVKVDDQLIDALRCGLDDFAKKNNCETVRVLRTEPAISL